MISLKSNSYKNIFKTTSIFGGVQVFNILLAILRSKFIAIFLGASGMGLVSLFTTTTGLIAGISNFGLGTSAVKNIATAMTSGDDEKLSKTIGVLRRLVWVTGGIGFILTIIMSPWLSELTFSNKTYTFSFILLSITLLLNQINIGQNAVLQGMRRITYMAKSNMIGAAMGLVVSVPLYYFFKENGIVPAIIFSSICALTLSWFFASKIKLPKYSPDFYVLKTEGKEMLQMGFIISLGSLITIGNSYIVKIFIRNLGGLDDVGLFTAGFAIISTYVGMVFTSMSTDYYPRLAAVADDNLKCKNEINQQAEIALLILSPILIIFLVFIKLGIVLLYSKDFLGAVSMVHWATLGIFFRALSWSIGYILLAKGSPSIFFWNELAANLYLLLLNILGYYFFGLTGLGVSFLISYMIHFIQMLIVSHTLYKFSLNKVPLRIFIFQFSIALFCFLNVYFLNEFTSYVIGIVLIVISFVYSWKGINKRINILDIVKNKLKRK